jgi:hypothetical protein
MIDRKNRHNELCIVLNDIYKRKNLAYGDAFSNTYAEFGIISAVTRMSDKWNRIKSLINGIENKIGDESLKDTLLDLANYCLMTVMEIEDADKS